MRIVIFNKNKLDYFELPIKIEGSYWLPDKNVGDRHLVSIDAVGNQ